jgi:hypothetical protein
MRGPAESIELTLEDPQSIGSRLVAVPAQPYVEQIDAKWPMAVGDVEIYDIRQALARDETQRGTGQVSVRVHRDDTAVLTRCVAARGARLTDAVYTLAAVQIALHEHVSPHQAAIQVAEQRHETRHALASWRPPRDSYRAVDLPR